MISPFDNIVWSVVDSMPTPLTFNRQQWFGLINAVIQKESTFNPNAVSYTGAGLGLMQVNPNIWLSTFGLTREQLFDPLINVRTGAKILYDYISQYGTMGGLSAYFAGPSGRLSAAAQSYAKTVLSIYNSIVSRLRNLFTTDKFYYTQPGIVDPELAFNELPDFVDSRIYQPPTPPVSSAPEIPWLIIGAAFFFFIAVMDD